MMKLTQSKGLITLEKEFPGIANCVFKHKIASTETEIVYAGPKIPHDEWHRLMTFFRWTYQTYHGEAQARGFLDFKENKIIFWAFPQKAQAGMSSDEIPGDEFNKQRAELPNADSLVYFLTNHHHCSCSAFQSGGDTNNEERPGGGAHEIGQDGLHITMGKMDLEVHDLDARFYIGGNKVIPKLSMFWDIGEEVKKMIPKEMHDVVARFQMCQKIDVEFPEQWRKNMIEVKLTPTDYSGVGRGYSHTTNGGFGYLAAGGGWSGQQEEPMWKRTEEAAEDVLETLADMDGLALEDAIAVLKFLCENPVVQTLWNSADLNKVDFDMLCREVKLELVRQQDEKDEKKEAQDALANEGGNGAIDKDEKLRETRKQRKQRKKEEKERAKIQVIKTTYPGPGHHWDNQKGEWVKDVIPNGAVTTSAQAHPAHGDVNDHGQYWDADKNAWIAT